MQLMVQNSGYIMSTERLKGFTSVQEYSNAWIRFQLFDIVIKGLIRHASQTQ